MMSEVKISADMQQENKTEYSHEKEIIIQEQPHMDSPTIAFLKKYMKKSKCYLEYGAGGSTRMAVHHNISYIFSVESDKAYGEAVRQVVDATRDNTYFKMYVPDLGPTKLWGFPKTREKFAQWWQYPIEIWSDIRSEKISPDLILIDGRFRSACFFASLLHAEPNTIIVFDDYKGREARYAGVAATLPIREMVGRAAVFEVPAQVEHRSLAVQLAKACVDPN